MDIQIIIKSKKEDISKNIKKIKKQIENEKSINNKIIVNNSEKYINFLKEKTQESFSTSKNFYILIKNKKSPEKTEEKIKKELLEEYYKIKEALSRCGNLVQDIKTKKELEKIILDFF